MTAPMLPNLSHLEALLGGLESNGEEVSLTALYLSVCPAEETAELLQAVKDPTHKASLCCAVSKLRSCSCNGAPDAAAAADARLPCLPLTIDNVHDMDLLDALHSDDGARTSLNGYLLQDEAEQALRSRQSLRRVAAWDDQHGAGPGQEGDTVSLQPTPSPAEITLRRRLSSVGMVQERIQRLLQGGAASLKPETTALLLAMDQQLQALKVKLLESGRCSSPPPLPSPSSSLPVAVAAPQVQPHPSAVGQEVPAAGAAQAQNAPLGLGPQSGALPQPNVPSVPAPAAASLMVNDVGAHSVQQHAAECRSDAYAQQLSEQVDAVRRSLQDSPSSALATSPTRPTAQPTGPASLQDAMQQVAALREMAERRKSNAGAPRAPCCNPSLPSASSVPVGANTGEIAPASTPQAPTLPHSANQPMTPRSAAAAQLVQLEQRMMQLLAVRSSGGGSGEILPAAAAALLSHASLPAGLGLTVTGTSSMAPSPSTRVALRDSSAPAVTSAGLPASLPSSVAGLPGSSPSCGAGQLVSSCSSAPASVREGVTQDLRKQALHMLMASNKVAGVAAAPAEGAAATPPGTSSLLSVASAPVPGGVGLHGLRQQALQLLSHRGSMPRAPGGPAARVWTAADI